MAQIPIVFVKKRSHFAKDRYLIFNSHSTPIMRRLNETHSPVLKTSSWWKVSCMRYAHHLSGAEIEKVPRIRYSEGGIQSVSLFPGITNDPFGAIMQPFFAVGLFSGGSCLPSRRHFSFKASYWRESETIVRNVPNCCQRL